MYLCYITNPSEFSIDWELKRFWFNPVIMTFAEPAVGSACMEDQHFGMGTIRHRRRMFNKRSVGN